MIGWRTLSRTTKQLEIGDKVMITAGPEALRNIGIHDRISGQTFKVSSIEKCESNRLMIYIGGPDRILWVRRTHCKKV